MGGRGEDFVGDFVGDFRGEEREDEDEDEDDVLLFCLLSGSVFFFLGEDLVKRPISVEM